MDRIGRWETIEDVLASLHTGQWFTFTDAHNKTYGNLTILDNSKDKPTEKELTDALAKQQSDFDSQAYARSRRPQYPNIGDQLDDLYKEGAFSASMTAKIKKVKDDNPKG